MNWKNKIFHTEDGDWIYVDAEGKDWAVFKSRAAAEGYAYASNSWRHWKDSYNGDEDEEVVEEPPQPPRLTDLEISRIIAKQALELVRTRMAAKR